jgi:POT family proton-dependent oligopeptide transporter
MMFVSGFDPLDRLARGVSFASRETVESLTASDSVLGQVAGVFLHEFGSPAGLFLLAASLGALGYIVAEMRRLAPIAIQRLCVALILTFFSFVFWALFEQAGSSLNAFADRNIDRVSERRHVTSDEVGTTLTLQPTQEQLGHYNGERLFTLGELTRLRDAHTETDFSIEWQVVESNIGMGVAERHDEVAASTFQAINPFYILILGLVFTALWSFLGSLRLEPSTPLKFALGLLQLGLGFGAFWYGAAHHDPRGMVWVGWLFLGYLLHTTGELCLSPVGLAMITRLSPRHLVSTMMGMWFLATSLSQFLAGIIAQFTKVDATGMVAEPIVTVTKYGGVYGFLATLAIGAAAVCLLMVPLLKAWMHEGEPDEDGEEA